MLSEHKLTDYSRWKSASIPDKGKLSKLRQKTQEPTGATQNLPDKGKLSKLRQKTQEPTGATQTLPEKGKLSKLRQKTQEPTGATQTLPDKGKLSKPQGERVGSADPLPDKSKPSKLRSSSSSEYLGREDMHSSAKDLNSIPTREVVVYHFTKCHIDSVGKISQEVDENSQFKLNPEGRIRQMHNQFNIETVVGNFANIVEGDQTYNSEQRKDIDEVVTEVNRLLSYVEEMNPTVHEMEVETQKAIEHSSTMKDRKSIELAIKSNPQLQYRLRRVLTAAGIETVKVIFAPAGILIEAVKAWIE
jgi:hypothetical protein